MTALSCWSGERIDKWQGEQGDQDSLRVNDTEWELGVVCGTIHELN